MTHILFTGGGTQGHVTPNLVLIDQLDTSRYIPVYMGSYTGIERTLTPCRYIGISTGKLRRYISLQNILDIFRVLVGIVMATWHIFWLKPAVIFSKGGYVSLPVVIGGYLNHVPIVIHESDLSLGLTTKLTQFMATHIFTSTPKPIDQFKVSVPIDVVGLPLSNRFFQPYTKPAHREKPELLVFGGSLGAAVLNDWVTDNLTALCASFSVIHVRGDQAGEPPQHANYQAYTRVAPDQFIGLLQSADIAICRAGATSIFELIATQTPHVLVPLGTASSRGDQLDNAAYFSSLGISEVVHENRLDQLMDAVQVTWRNKAAFGENMASYTALHTSAKTVLATLYSYV